MEEINLRDSGYDQSIFRSYAPGEGVDVDLILLSPADGLLKRRQIIYARKDHTECCHGRDWQDLPSWQVQLLAGVGVHEEHTAAGSMEG